MLLHHVLSQYSRTTCGTWHHCVILFADASTLIQTAAQAMCLGFVLGLIFVCDFAGSYTPSHIHLLQSGTSRPRVLVCFVPGKTCYVLVDMVLHAKWTQDRN